MIDLTPRQLDIANELKKGFSNREIAEALFITDDAVKFHLTRIYRKLGVKSRAEAIVLILNGNRDERQLEFPA